MSEREKAMVYRSSLLFLLIAVCSAVAEDPLCEETAYGWFCSNLFPTRMTLADDAVLLVGGNNSLYSFNTFPTLELRQKVSIRPDNFTESDCIATTVKSQCHNLIRIIQPVPQEALQGNYSLQLKFNDTVLVCGTNAFSPKCSVHKRTDLSDSMFLTDGIDEGFSPFSIFSQSIGLLATNGKFYTGTIFGKFQRKYRAAVAPNPLQGDGSFQASTLDTNPLWISQDPNTQFVSMYEIGEHVYIFMRESAYEINQGKSIVYSRVMRVCKTDEGIDESILSIRRFRTFQKIRMTCPYPSSTSSSLPYYYNDITSTYLHWPKGSTLPTLYATFSAPTNGPEGSAVCKFSFDSNESYNLVKGFQDGVYYELDGNSGLVMATRGKFACPGSPGTQRSDVLAEMDQLVVGEALPVGGGALLTTGGVTYVQIAVDVFTFNGSGYEIMYIGTRDGLIKALIRETVNSETIERMFDIFKPTKSSSDNSITQLMLAISNETQTRQLYATTSSFLSTIILGNCSKYTSCADCLESTDPYCVWQNSECINKLSSRYIEGIQTAEATKPPTNILNFCGISSSSAQARTTTISSTSVITSTSCKIPTTTIVATKTTTKLITATRKSSETTSISSPTISTMSAQFTSVMSTSQTSYLPIISVTPSDGGLGTFSSKVPVIEIVSTLVGGLLCGFIVGMVVCCIGLGVRHMLMIKGNNDTPVHNSNGNIYDRQHSNGSIGHYKITVMFPESKKDEEDEKEPQPPMSSPSPVGLEELEDDVIGDLPTNISPVGQNGRHNNKWSVPRGRTESTRWLRASESESINESPQPPF